MELYTGSVRAPPPQVMARAAPLTSALALDPLGAPAVLIESEGVAEEALRVAGDAPKAQEAKSMFRRRVLVRPLGAYTELL